MSLYEQLILEGRQEAFKEGWQEGFDQVMVKAVKAMTKLNMDAEAIATALDLPLKQVQHYMAQPD